MLPAFTDVTYEQRPVMLTQFTHLLQILQTCTFLSQSIVFYFIAVIIVDLLIIFLQKFVANKLFIRYINF